MDYEKISVIQFFYGTADFASIDYNGELVY